MRISIRWKILILIMVLALVPLIVLGFISTGNISEMGDSAISDVEEMTNTAVEDSSAALNNLGENMVNSAAISLRKQVALYLEAHPDATLEDLQNDPEFQAIAVQPIWEGKTTRTQAYTLIAYATISDTIGFNIAFAHLEKDLVEWNIDEMVGGAEGYEEALEEFMAGNDICISFNWDGTYLYAFNAMPTADTITADGIPLICSAWIPIDELNEPATLLESTMSSNKNNVIATIDDAKSNNQASMWITVAVTALIVAVLSIFFARGFTSPIKQLTDVADRISMGDLGVSINVKSNDEIGELSESFGRMVTAVKYLSQDDNEA